MRLENSAERDNAASREYYHFIPNLQFGGAEAFLIRLATGLRGRHTIVTFWKDREDNLMLPKEINRKSINIFRGGAWNALSLCYLISRLGPNDRVLSWLYLGDLVATLYHHITFASAVLVWNIRNTRIKSGQYSAFSMGAFHICRLLLVKRPAVIVFNSRVAAEEHIKAGYPSDKCMVIYNGFEDLSGSWEESVEVENGIFNIACVGRYHPQKNHTFILKTLSKCLDIPFRLHLVGKGLDSKNTTLLKEIHQEIGNRYKLYGPQPQPFVHSLFKSCNISVLGSKFGEAFPNVVAESMIQGCIPICMNVGDAAQIVGGYGACLRLETDPEEFAQEIRDMYNHYTYERESWDTERYNMQKMAMRRFSLSSAIASFDRL